MRAFLRLFLDIWMLRRGPQDVPYSMQLARGLVLLLLGLQWILLILLEVEEQQLLQLVYSLIWMLGAPWLLLRLRDRQTRYVQTLTAKCGVGLLYLVLFAPMLMIARSIDTTTPDVSPEPLQIIAVWGVLGLTVWHLIVSGHIWRHALGVPMFLGTMISIALFTSNVLLSRMLFAATP
jgi:hypothetical protein